MKKKLLTLLLSAALACSVFAGCGSDSSKESDKKTEASSDKKDTTDTKKDVSEEEAILESEVDEADSELADMDNAAVTGTFSDMEAYGEYKPYKLVKSEKEFISQVLDM